MVSKCGAQPGMMVLVQVDGSVYEELEFPTHLILARKNLTTPWFRAKIVSRPGLYCGAVY